VLVLRPGGWQDEPEARTLTPPGPSVFMFRPEAGVASATRCADGLVDRIQPGEGLPSVAARNVGAAQA